MTKRQQAPDLVWPTLVLPPSPQRPLVYLDLNHWISLAQARSGHPSGRAFQEALEFTRQARQSETAAFVLSASLYMEMAKIADPAQRFAVCDLMEELTDFASLAWRVVIMELEMDAALRYRGFPGPSLPAVGVTGYGFKQAFGLTGGPRIMGPNGDETEPFRERFGPAKFDRLLEEQLLDLERSVLRGPADDEVAELRSLGWKPEVQIATAGVRADQETEQSADFKKAESGGGATSCNGPSWRGSS